MPKIIHTPRPDFSALGIALAEMPARLTLLLGTGKTRTNEPLFGVQLFHDGEVVAEAEHDDGARCVRMAIAQVML